MSFLLMPPRANSGQARTLLDRDSEKLEACFSPEIATKSPENPRADAGAREGEAGRGGAYSEHGEGSPRNVREHNYDQFPGV